MMMIMIINHSQLLYHVPKRSEYLHQSHDASLITLSNNHDDDDNNDDDDNDNLYIIGAVCMSQK